MEALEVSALGRDPFPFVRQLPLAGGESGCTLLERRFACGQRLCRDTLDVFVGRTLSSQAEDASPRVFGIPFTLVDLRPGTLDLGLARRDLCRALAQRALQLVELGEVMDTLSRPLLGELACEAQDVVSVRAVVGFPRVVFPAFGHRAECSAITVIRLTVSSRRS